MELKLQLVVLVLFIHGSLATFQRMTAIQGQTLELNCPIKNPSNNNVEWKNPDKHSMFFNRAKGEGLRDIRYSITKFTQSQFSVSISDVTFKDAGTYTCTEFDHPPIETEVHVTVFGRPKITFTKERGRFVIKCTAESSKGYPKMYWKVDNDHEIHAHHPQSLHEDKRFVTIDMIHVNPKRNKATVKCLVKDRDLPTPLMDFIQIGSEKPGAVTRPPTPHPQGSTRGPRTTTSRIIYEGTTVYITRGDEDGPSSESSATVSTVSSNETVTEHTPVTSTDDHFELSNTTRNGNESSTRNTTDWTYDTTEETPFYNETERNKTVISNDLERQMANKGNSSLLVFLVTCLILALLIVVIFFGIKLRRAHLAWKRENEDSVPSEESNKSKSSHEEKNAQGQRWRGLSNMAFTQYVTEEPRGITSVVNTGAMAAAERTHIGHIPQPQTQPTPARSNIKETEL